MAATEEPTPAGRGARLWRTVSAAGLTLAAAGGLAALFRVPLVDFVLHRVAAQGGVDAAWTVENVGFSELGLGDVRIGPEGAALLAAERLEIGWGFGGLRRIEADAPALRLVFTESGLDLSALGDFTPKPTKDPKPARPLRPITVAIRDGQAEITSPFGPLAAAFEASGTLTRDFAARALIEGAPGQGAKLTHGLTAQLTAETKADALHLAVIGTGASLLAPELELALGGVTFDGAARLPHAMTAADISLKAASASLAVGPYAAQGAAATLEANAGLDAAGAWRASLTHTAQRSGLAGADLVLPQAKAALQGTRAGAAGEWTVAAASAEAAGIVSSELTAAGPVRLSLEEGLGVTLNGSAASRKASVSRPARRAVFAALPDLGGTPFGPLVLALKPALNRAMDEFAWSAPVALDWAKGAGAVRVPGQVEVTAASGANVRWTPAGEDAPLVSHSLPDGPTRLAGAIAIAGGGLPRASIDIRRLELGPAWAADLQAAIPDWRAAGAALSLADLKITGADGVLRTTGAGEISGPLGALQVEGLRLPLDWRLELPKDGGLALQAEGALALSARALDTPAARFVDVTLPITLDADGLVRRAADGTWGGGGRTGPVRLAGVTAEQGEASAGWAGLRFTNRGRSTLAIAASLAAPQLTMAAGEGRSVTLAAGKLTADTTVAANGTWRIDGRLAEGRLEDPALPASVEAMGLAWTAAPKGGDVALTFRDGAALISDKEARPRFNPIRIADVGGQLEAGEVRGQGGVRLASSDMPLAAFEGRHRLAEGTGDAAILARGLTFSRDLELFELTELARGVVEAVRGAVDADFNARWGADQFAVDGAMTLTGIDAATAGLGPIEDVSGRIEFDDLTRLTTPPGQVLNIGALNPGVAVRGGAVQFQLLEDGAVRLEDVRFPFAGGALSVAPTDIKIGADSTQYVVRLENVDMTDLVAQLNLKDLVATGRAEGTFPLIITPRGARIENGVLTTAAGGGRISYTGEVGEAAQGAAQIAFNALKNFQYESFTLGLNGDLDGDIESTIRFAGISLAPVSPPGALPLGLSMRGAERVPFRFNVTVRAPLQALVSETDKLINPIKRIQDQTQTGVDLEDVP